MSYKHYIRPGEADRVLNGPLFNRISDLEILVEKNAAKIKANKKTKEEEENLIDNTFTDIIHEVESYDALLNQYHPCADVTKLRLYTLEAKTKIYQLLSLHMDPIRFLTILKRNDTE